MTPREMIKQEFQRLASENRLSEATDENLAEFVIERLMRERDALKALLRAVNVEMHHIRCEDVGGKNWFDLRDAALWKEER